MNNSNEDFFFDFEDIQEVLADKVERWTIDNPRFDTEIPGFALRRSDKVTDPSSYMHEPSICLIVQGAKNFYLGDESYAYDAYNYLITSIDLPVVANVIEASKEKPYLGLILKIDFKEVSQMMVGTNLPLPKLREASRGIAVSRVSRPLLNAIERLIDLLDEPENIPMLSPLIQREILFRILVGEQGQRLKQIAVAGSRSHQIAKSVQCLKENFAKPLRIKELANIAGMSNSTFHHHFRTLTSMSPLQYQKFIRLHEARRLMLTERLDAATASFNVGYDSPSQFNREYSRLFGSPPLRDIKNLTKTSDSFQIRN